MTESNVKKNMALWNKYCETNPQWTKRINMRGGFTGIDSYSQLRLATEEFGPFGVEWGLKNLEIHFIYDDTKCVGLYAQSIFFYPYDAKTGEIPVAADMPYKPNDDCVKKVRTECISKALSMLGFNADVFLGKFDDNRYVSEMKKKYEQQKNDLQTDITKPKMLEPKDGTIAMILDMIRDELMERCDDNYKGAVDMKLLEEAIISEYGKLPVKESSVPMVADKMWELCKEDDSLLFVNVDEVIKGI